MTIRERIASLKLNVKQHQDQIKILLKEIRELEHYKTISNDNSTIDNSNISNDNIINNFCISTDDKILSKNENLNKFI